MKKYSVETDHGFGLWAMEKEFDDYQEAKEYAKAYTNYFEVSTKVTNEYDMTLRTYHPRR